MGFSAVITAALKGLTWQRIASMAMEYGPVFYRQAREHLNKGDGPAAPSRAEAELEERIARLEKLLLEQDELIRGQAARNEQLEEACLRLESRLTTAKIACAVLACIALILTAMMLRHG
jgi:hypothetical protein